MYTTLIFWLVAFSLNPDLLVDIVHINRFIKFLWPPITIACITSLYAIYRFQFFREKNSRVMVFSAVIINGIFLSAFAATGQIYKHYLIQNAANVIGYDCMNQRPFYESLLNVPRDFQFYSHAVLMKNNVKMLWSYSELNFFPLDERTSPNIVSCN